MNQSRLVGALRAGLAISLIVLGGCASIDPDGEWRGTPEARLRACQAMFGPAAMSVREQFAEATGSTMSAASRAVMEIASSLTAGVPAGAHCPAPRPDGVAPGPTGESPGGGRGPRVTTPEAIERALGASEHAYSEARYEEAIQLLEPLLADQPQHARGWLRQGNALHRLDRRSEAAVAYRRASDLAADRLSRARSPDSESTDVLAKASANLAILGIEQARQALDALGPADGNPGAAAHRGRIEAALRAVIRADGEGSPPRSSTLSRQPLAGGTDRLPKTDVPVPAVSTWSPSGARAAEPALRVDSSAVKLPSPGASAGPAGIEVIRGLTGR